MPNKEEFIAKIVDAEWKMFQNVPNIGGRALCQEEFRTFKINRFGQFMHWPEAALESYLCDLTEAEKTGRNLLTEKYARMMESTSPEEYSKIGDLLPSLSPEVIFLIEEIIKIELTWEEEIISKYPNVANRGRPIHSTDDILGTTSIETYLRGELSTYSLRTLRLYYDDILKKKSEKINGFEVTLEYTMNQYGFKSLREANDKLKRFD